MRFDRLPSRACFPSANLEGNVRAADLTIPEGAFFNGECKMISSQEDKTNSEESG